MEFIVADHVVSFKPRRLVIAGYTSKDQEALIAHIEELKELGIPAPPRVPMMYDLSPELLQPSPELTQVSNDGSGEAEVVALDIAGRWYIGLGSDHTDRVLEAVSIQKSKQVCAKPVSKELWALDEIVDHWDQIEMRSWVLVDGEEQLYQSGKLDSFMTPEELYRIVEERGYASRGIALFCGTLPLLEGHFQFGSAFRAELFDPVTNKTISLQYMVKILKDAEEE